MKSIFSPQLTEEHRREAERLIAGSESEVSKRAIAAALDITLRPYRARRNGRKWRRA